MKTSLKSLLAVGMLTAGFANAAAAAQVDVYITGSSAFRGAVTNAICQLLTSPKGAYEGSSTNAIAGANQQLIVGVPNSTGTAAGLNGNATYYFHTCWTGSLGGLATLVYGVEPTLPSITPTLNAHYPYIVDTTSLGPITVGSGTVPSGSNQGALAAGATGGANYTTDVTGSAAVPPGGRYADGAFSDVFQSSTTFQKVTLTAATVDPSNNITDGIVGVIPFVFVANPDLATLQVENSAGTGTVAFDTTSPNITATTAQQLYGGGIFVPQLTGNPTDLGNALEVLATGRDADSGTRFTTFAETGFNPVGGTTKPTQYQVTAGSTIDVSLFPAKNLFPGTQAEQDFSAGQGGYSSGSNERGALAVSGTAGSSSDNPSYIIGSLGESDASTIVTSATSGPAYLAYNGVKYATYGTTGSSFNRTLLEQGFYTLWGYEHAYLDPNTSNATAINAVAAQVRSSDALISGDQISNMAVQRSQEGAPISYVGVGNTSL